MREREGSKIDSYILCFISLFCSQPCPTPSYFLSIDLSLHAFLFTSFLILSFLRLISPFLCFFLLSSLIILFFSSYPPFSTPFFSFLSFYIRLLSLLHSSFLCLISPHSSHPFSFNTKTGV